MGRASIHRSTLARHSPAHMWIFPSQTALSEVRLESLVCVQSRSAPALSVYVGAGRRLSFVMASGPRTGRERPSATISRLKDRRRETTGAPFGGGRGQRTFAPPCSGLVRATMPIPTQSGPSALSATPRKTRPTPGRRPSPRPESASYGVAAGTRSERQSCWRGGYKERCLASHAPPFASRHSAGWPRAGSGPCKNDPRAGATPSRRRQCSVERTTNTVHGFCTGLPEFDPFSPSLITFGS